MTTAIESCLERVSPDVRLILERSLAGHEVSVEDGIALNEARGTDLHALCLVADELRRAQVGDRVTVVQALRVLPQRQRVAHAQHQFALVYRLGQEVRRTELQRAQPGVGA